MSYADDTRWQQWFQAAIITASQIADKNPSRGIAISNQSGLYQLYAWDVSSGSLRQITASGSGQVFGGISPDGNYIYYLKSEQDDDQGHFVRVAFDGGEETNLTPGTPFYTSYYIGQSLNGSTLGFTLVTQDGFRMYRVPLAEDGSLGQRQLIYRSQRTSLGPMLSHDGDYAVVATMERSQYDEFSLMVFRIQENGEINPDVLFMHDEESSLKPIGFSPAPGDARFLGNTNVTGYDRPVIWDIKTETRIDLPLNDLKDNAAAWGWSPDGTRILLCNLYQGNYQLYVYDLERSTLDRLDHPTGTLSSGYFAGDDEIFVNWQDATHPPQVIALDAHTGQMKRSVLSTQAELPTGQPWRSVTFYSSGNTEVQAWVATPEGTGPFPTILHTHDGPTSVMSNLFHAEAQTWLAHGFAWMSINYRGSVTFGEAYMQAILGILGHREVDDMVAGYHWLVNNRIAKPDAIFLTGTGYGGYLTLQAMGRQPDLWAGGIAVTAITDWRLMYEDLAQPLRGYPYSLFGGSPEERPDQYRAASPVTYVDAVTAPLLIIQGEDDPRCPSRQMRVYAQQLEARAKDFTLHWYDAKHGPPSIQQNIDHMKLKLDFAIRLSE